MDVHCRVGAKSFVAIIITGRHSGVQAFPGPKTSVLPPPLPHVARASSLPGGAGSPLLSLGAPRAAAATPPAIRFVSGNRLLSEASDWLQAKTQFSTQSSCISGPLSLSPPPPPLIAICSVISFSNTAEHREAAAQEPGREEGKRAPAPCSEPAGPALCRVCVCVCHVCVSRTRHTWVCGDTANNQAPAGSDQGTQLYQALGSYHLFNPCNNMDNCRHYHSV